MVDGTTMESSRTTGGDRERGGSKGRKEDGQKETSGREKEGSSGCNFGGFLVVQVAVKNSWKVNHFLRPLARSPCGGAPEVSLMLRYFTRKLFKSNILPAVIKYKLHRGEARALKYSPSARAIPTFPEGELDNNSPLAEMKTFDSFASGAKASPSRQYFYSRRNLQKCSPTLFLIAFHAFSNNKDSISLANWPLSTDVDRSRNDLVFAETRDFSLLLSFLFFFNFSYFRPRISNLNAKTSFVSPRNYTDPVTRSTTISFPPEKPTRRLRSQVCRPLPSWDLCMSRQPVAR